MINGKQGFQSTIRKLMFGDAAFHTFCLVFLFISGIIVLYPLIYTVACSFSETSAIIRGDVFLWPVNFTLNAYRIVFNYNLLRNGFLNSLLYVAGGTTVAVSLLLLSAYPLSRRDLKDRHFFQVFFLVTMFFNGGIIPNYILMSKLGLVGSRWSLIVGFMFSCYNMIIVKSYFQNSIPQGLLDAAHIDGCGDIRFFYSIAIPLATPVIAVMILFNAIGIWNGYFNGMMYLTRSSTYSFQMVLRNILFIINMPPDQLATLDPSLLQQMLNLLLQLRYAVLVVGALPMMLLYPFIQKYFIRGMMIGSLKE
jgi:multiple sugar transport system permease protein/putative aldouronate transport system permease protein